jgi:hypothetical protein
MNTIKLTLVLSLFGLLFGTSSCVDELFLEGNGNLRTESRGASGFEEIASSGDFDVTIVPGSSYSVEVSAESNLLSYIETDVVGKKLKIRTRGVHSLRLNYPIEVYITTPVLNGLSLSGSGIIKTGSFMSDDFKIAISGSGDVYVNASHTIDARISGSGRVFYINHPVIHTSISGSGKVVDKN